jgi:predicted DCC family thiol-disulfide oxidoreductase YuxK
MQTPNSITPSGPIIVFDGLCVLCSANAQFVLAHDKRGYFRLAAMQGETGSRLFTRFGIDPSDPNTIIVVQGDTVWTNSDAVLKIYDGLGWPWRMATIFKIVPRFLRDPIYFLIAKNRYRIFGKRETCWLPTPDQRARVLS